MTDPNIRYLQVHWMALKVRWVICRAFEVSLGVGLVFAFADPLLSLTVLNSAMEEVKGQK